MRDGPEHYTRLDPQPVDVIMAWGLNWHLSNVIKYVARCDAKGGLVDLLKAKHYLEMEIERIERQRGGEHR